LINNDDASRRMISYDERSTSCDVLRIYPDGHTLTLLIYFILNVAEMLVLHGVHYKMVERLGRWMWCAGRQHVDDFNNPSKSIRIVT
jgi:hypothetical protein